MYSTRLLRKYGRLYICRFDSWPWSGQTKDYKIDICWLSSKSKIVDWFLLKVQWAVFQLEYSQTCIKRSLLGQRESGLVRQVTSLKRFNSYEIFYDRTGNRWPFDTDDCSIQVTAWAGLTICWFSIKPKG